MAATGNFSSYEKLQALIKEKPELSSTVSEKLEFVLNELELDESSTEGKTNFEKIHLGFRKFKSGIYEKNPELTNKLKTGQWPKFMVVACSDSRVDPSIILGLKPGDAFIVRNIANMVPPYEKEGYPSVASALEYAILHLKVEHVLVVGHSACGGVGALVKMTPDDGKYSTTFIERWVEIGKPARKDVKAQSPNADVADVCKSCEKESVNNSLNNLRTYPFVVEAVNSDKVTLHGGYYDFLDGTFDTWDFKFEDRKDVDAALISEMSAAMKGHFDYEEKDAIGGSVDDAIGGSIKDIGHFHFGG